MVSGSYRQYLASASPVVWFFRLIVLAVFAASFVLLPVASEAAVQPALVTIATRVVGTGPNPYSTQLCTQSCTSSKPSLTTYPATGSGPGYHMVALERATLTLILNKTYGLDSTSLNSMNHDVMGLSNGTLVIISSIGPSSSIGSGATGLLDNIATYLGGTGPGVMYFPGVNLSPNRFSLIGIPASGAPANQVSDAADPDTDGNIAGVLVEDIQKNYAFVYSSFVTIETMAGLQADTIMIGNKAFEAPPLPAGTLGGFHLLVLKRLTLDRIATDPTVVVWHTSYATNSNDAATATAEAQRMFNDLNRFPNGISTGELIFIISTLGSDPGFGPFSSSVFTNALQIQAFISELGGTNDFFDNFLGGKNGGFYSLIGIPNSGDPTLSPEVRSWATPQLAGNITTLMQQNAAGLFTPIGSSAFPPSALPANTSLDLSLYFTAYAAPSQWPVAANGSDAVCPAGDQQCAAYQWISFQIICAGNQNCTNEDVRGEYANLAQTLDRGVLEGLTYPKQPTNNPAVPFFTANAFQQVKNQLNIEFALVNDVRNYFSVMTDATDGFAIKEQDDLNSAYADVQADVQLPPATTASVNILGLFRDGLMIGQIVGAFAAPELAPAFAVESAVVYGVMQVNKSSKGASNNQVLATYGELASQIGAQYVNAFGQAAVLENILLTDWNKLQTIGTKIENAQQGSAWYLDDGVVANIATALSSVTTVGFYETLMPAKYKIVTFGNVPFNSPSGYSYSYDCNTYTYTCCCSGHIYSPPSGAWLTVAGPPNAIFMAISSSDGSYPSSSLTTKLFCAMGLYYSDFFMSNRGWSAMAGALPQGWSDYQNNGGTCGDASTSCGVPPAKASQIRHGLPGAGLGQRPLLEKLIAAARRHHKRKPPGNHEPPGNIFCSARG